ncbi:MAG: molybdopterin-guanine dinucleotide biosynthesis protein B [Pirellulaceae bacterium]|nr:molybdopterin-guanine dinucleotide biosynthesis protein B [Pirellulaceae bacterium]
MKRIHIVGRKNNGKTQLVVDLVRELTAQSFRVATIKHTHHQHELDTPGKDSWQHRQAGAAMVGVLSHNLTALFVPIEPQDGGDDRYDLLAPMFAGCDLVLVEGNLATRAPKIEVWRASVGSTPIYLDDPGIELVVSDDELPDSKACTSPPKKLSRDDINQIVDWIISRESLTEGERSLS